jgi:diaminohydroxyphosphoribosylaminopyrimidine deaminase/5-amino-6-(5-phosphoribosylamino)uracil reductase
MARALELAEAVRRRTPPNPWVGCVLTRDGEIVGEGATEPPGGPHAEVLALRAAGDRAHGATAYTTLEPCSHVGRTGPCADALIEAGIARVVVAVEDPDPEVSADGIARLRDAGIAVAVGTLEREVSQSLAPYLHHRRSGRAFCVVKTAVSLDGRTAAADGTSQWITGEQARADAHRLRADSQAVVVGAGTALADRPTLTARDIDAPVDRQPLRVVLDARGRVPAEGPLFDAAIAPTLVVTTDAADPTFVDTWRAAGAKVETVPPAARGVDLDATLSLLAREGVLQALVEGGAMVHASLVAGGLADRLVTYIAGLVLGADGRPAVDWPGPTTLAEAPRYELTGAQVLGGDVRLEHSPVGRGST